MEPLPLHVIDHLADHIIGIVPLHQSDVDGGCRLRRHHRSCLRTGPGALQSADVQRRLIDPFHE